MPAPDPAEERNIEALLDAYQRAWERLQEAIERRNNRGN